MTRYQLPTPDATDLDWPELLRRAATLRVNVYRVDEDGRGHIVTAPPAKRAASNHQPKDTK